MARWLAWAAMAWVAVASTARGAIITDPAFGFTMDVPDSYAPQPATGDLLYQFTRVNPADGSVIAVLTVQRLHQMIHSGDHVQPETGGTRVSRRWNGNAIDVYQSHVTRGEVSGNVRLAVLPLAGEGVQVAVLVRDGSPLSVDNELNNILNNFEPAGGAPPATDEPAQTSTGYTATDSPSRTTPAAPEVVERGPAGITLQVVLGVCVWGGLGGMLLTPAKRRPAGAAPPTLATSADLRRRTAVKWGCLGGVGVFVLLVAAGFAAYAAHWRFFDRFEAHDVGKLIVVAPVWLAGWAALMTIYVLRLVFRAKFGPVKSTRVATAAATPDFSAFGPADGE